MLNGTHILQVQYVKTSGKAGFGYDYRFRSFSSSAENFVLDFLPVHLQTDSLDMPPRGARPADRYRQGRGTLRTCTLRYKSGSGITGQVRGGLTALRHCKPPTENGGVESLFPEQPDTGQCPRAGRVLHRPASPRRDLCSVAWIDDPCSPTRPLDLPLVRTETL